jgi:hypothetical protein
MKNLVLIGLLVVGFVTATGCGTYPLKHYPAGLSQQDAAKQRCECEREASRAVPVQNDDTWIYVARMRNACLAAKDWTE